MPTLPRAPIHSPFPPRLVGQGMVEYGLIIALVSIMAIAGLIILGPKLSALFSSFASRV